MKKTAGGADFYARYHDDYAAVGAKYARLRAMLEAALVDGFWGDEGRLPTEHELARVTGMSLGTIQRALRELVGEGRLVRMPGRGTYVIKAKYHLDEPFIHARFLSNDGKTLVPVQASLVGRGHLRDKGPWTQVLSPANGAVFRVERLFDVNGEFNVLSRFYLDPVRFPKFVELSPGDLRSTNLKRLLSRMHRLPAITHRQTLRFLRYPADLCRALKCRTGTTGLLQAITASIEGEDAIYYHELFIPPNDRALQLPDAVLRRSS